MNRDALKNIGAILFVVCLATAGLALNERPPVDGEQQHGLARELALAGSSSAGTPGGSDTQIQFNDGSSFGGDAGLTYNKTTDKLTVGGLTLGGTNIFEATSLRFYLTGTLTNKVAAYRLETEGAIELGGNQTYNMLQRSSDGRWGFNALGGNVGANMGTSFGLREIATITSNTTIQNGDGYVVYRVDASAGPFTLTLPNAAQNQSKVFFIKKIDASTNAVIIASAQGVDDAVNQRLTSPGQAAMIGSDNSQWWSYVQRAQHQKRDIIDGSEWLVTAGNALVYFNTTTYWKNGFWAQNTAASNDSKQAFIKLKAGTYDVKELGGTGQGRAIVKNSIIDERGVTNNVWSTDWYNNGDQVNVLKTQTNVLIPNDGAYRMKKEVLSRNASANDWFEVLVETRWDRKGD